MQKQPLPRQVDARKLAGARARIDAFEAVRSFPRFASGLHDDTGDVEIGLDFFRDEQRLFRISGDISASVNVVCQRCLRPMPITVDSCFEIAVVWTEAQAQALPKSLDALVLSSDLLDLMPLLEDELILGTPIVSYHELADCGVSMPMAFGDPANQDEKHEAGEGRENPFSVLEKLKSSDT